nr:alpha/beta hydrolase [Pseudomonas sp. DP-17]
MLNLATQLKPIEAYSLGEIRELWRLTALALGTRPPLASVRQFDIQGPDGELSLRIYTPSRQDTLRPAFVWIHGGGFMVGCLDTAESICRNIAQAANCITVAISYRLAPEHDLNASRDDCLAALSWIVDHAQELGIDTERLAIGGDSAGGNLTAVIAQESRSQGLKLALQVLAYPATELLQAFPSLTENADGYMVTQHMLGYIQRTIARSAEHLDLSSPRLSPRRQRNLRGVAPALIISAGLDPIRDRWPGLCGAPTQRRCAGTTAALSGTVSRFPQFRRHQWRRQRRVAAHQRGTEGGFRRAACRHHAGNRRCHAGPRSRQ